MKKVIGALTLVLICLSVSICGQTPFTISGELRDDAGAIIFKGGNVCALLKIPAGLNVRDKVCAESDEHGKFTISITQPGTYALVADKMSEGYWPSYSPFYKDPKATPPEVRIDDGNSTQTVSVRMPPKTGVVTGKVIDEATDNRVPKFIVWFWQARDPNARTHLVFHGQSGMFRMFAPANVPFVMRVTADGYEDWVVGGGVLISLAGAKKGPGFIIVRSGLKSDFAIYLKHREPPPVDPTVATRLPAPLQLAPPDNQFYEHDQFPLNVKLEWNPVAGAISYGIEIEACHNRSMEAIQRLPDDGECLNPQPYVEKYGLHDSNYDLTFPGAQPGRWRVWAYDQNHKPGMKSPWRRWNFIPRIISSP